METPRYDELLSAYLDRELSPDERAAVDRLLEKSPAAQERLRELEVTSRFLRALPQHQLGADFAESVIDRLRSESLLRVEPVVPPPPRPRYVLRYGAPLAALAASALIAVLTLPSGPQRDATVVREDSDAFPLRPDAPILANRSSEQWEVGDMLEILGPNGIKHFELIVLAKTSEPNAIHCVMGESLGSVEHTDSATSTGAESQAVIPANVTHLAIVADEEQIDKLKNLLEQTHDETGHALPLVDIVTDIEPERVRMAAIDSHIRLNAESARDAALAAKAPSEIGETLEVEAVGIAQEKTPVVGGARPADEEARPQQRMMRSRFAAPSTAAAEPPAARDKRVPSSELELLPSISGPPLVVPRPLLADSALDGPKNDADHELADSSKQAVVSEEPAIQERTQQVQARRFEISRDTTHHVEELKKTQRDERPVARHSPKDSELPRRWHVLLRFKTDRTD